MLDKLRTEQASVVSVNDKDVLSGSPELHKDASSANKNEFLSLKVSCIFLYVIMGIAGSKNECDGCSIP